MHSRHVVSVERKSCAQIEIMREAGRIVAETLQIVADAARPGVTTQELDGLAEEAIRRRGAVPSFLGYMGYPATICAELDDIVVHGIPDDVRLEEGQLLGIDLGARYQGYQGDASISFGIGEVDEKCRRLLQVTAESLDLGIAQAQVGNRLREVCRAIQQHAESNGFGVVRELVGHGIGRQMHEPPQIPNFVEEGQFSDYNIILRPGMTLAIEPMINMGTADVVQDADGWTVRTADSLPSAHFEHTIAVCKDGPQILTRI